MQTEMSAMYQQADLGELSPIDRPIIFSGPMVKALLLGAKTQTRRLAWSGGKKGPVRPSPWRKAAPGDRLWVRETWAPRLDEGGASPAACYAAEPAGSDRRFTGLWKPSIHMPRWASRLTLTLTGQRVEPLQAITEEDAIAEGVRTISVADVPRQASWSERQDFARLWDSLHDTHRWGDNPEVVVLTFTLEVRNIDAPAVLRAA